ncbi:hypothetical protein ACN082_07700 [Rothia sp. CCM 9417]|uniref:hypothetical protein n=1 Tax=Rothia sp. CCM 9417 TaxID=3402657 RepID=UPI003AEBD303
MTLSTNRRTALKGLAIAAPLMAVAPAAFADSTTPPGGQPQPTPTPHPGHPHPTPNPGNPNPPSTGGGGQVPLPPGCHDGNWMSQIPCAHFTDQSNGEGWCFGNTTTLTLDASAGSAGYDVQCYLVPVCGDGSRANTHGDAAERFRCISRGYYSSGNFFAGNWTSPCDVSGLTMPYAFDGCSSGPCTITLPQGSIMVQSNNVCFSNTHGVGKLQIKTANRWFSSCQSWIKAIWVIRNKATGHWHVLDTVGIAGNTWRSGYDGKF